MHIVLVDTALDGHHLEYAGFLGQHFVRSGDEVVFVTYGTAVDWQGLSEAGVRIETLTRARMPEHPVPTVTRLRRGVATMQYALKIARHRPGSVVHHVYLDRNELPLAYSMKWSRGMSRLGLRVFATLFWPYFVHASRVDLARKSYHGANAAALRHMLRHGQLRALFVHHELIKAQLVARLGDAGVSNRIVVIPDPVETQLDSMASSDARRRLGLPLGKPVFLFFGGMRSDKGPDVALKALERLPASCCLVMAGSPGPHTPEGAAATRRQIAGSGKELITRLDWISDEDARLYFAAADAVLIPYREVYAGTSGVLQRSAAAGRPVIASDTSILGAIVRDNRMGITVAPGSSGALAHGMLTFLRMSAQERAEAGRAARAYALRCDWRIMAARVRNAYSEFGGDLEQ